MLATASGPSPPPPSGKQGVRQSDPETLSDGKPAAASGTILEREAAVQQKEDEDDEDDRDPDARECPRVPPPLPAPPVLRRRPEGERRGRQHLGAVHQQL